MSESLSGIQGAPDPDYPKERIEDSWGDAQGTPWEYPYPLGDSVDSPSDMLDNNPNHEMGSSGATPTNPRSRKELPRQGSSNWVNENKRRAEEFERRNPMTPEEQAEQKHRNRRGLDELRRILKSDSEDDQ